MLRPSKSGANLELPYRNKAPMTGVRLWGTEGPSKGIGAWGPKGLEPNH